MRRTRAISLADQVLSNASNALFTFLLAGLASAAAFGQFAVGYATLAFGVAAWRSGLGYQVSMKSGDSDAVRTESHRALAVSFLASPILAVVVLAAGGLLGGHADPVLAWGLAIATPFVLTQDLLRYSAVAAGKASIALISDSVWAALMLVAVVGRVQEVLQPAWLVGLWCAGAVVATLVLILALGARPQIAGARGWIRDSWRGRSHLLGGALGAAASVPVTAALVARIASPEVVGATTGAGQLMAPVNSLVAWLSLTLLAHASLAKPAQKLRIFARAGLSAGGLTLAWAVVLVILPAAVGRALLGDTWSLASTVLPIVAAQYAIAVLASTGDMLLMSLGQTRQVMINGLVVAGTRVALGCGAATVFGTAIAATSAEAVTMAVWLSAATVGVVRGRRWAAPG